MRNRTPDSFPLTDSGNAELIAAKFADRLRFDHRRKKWLIWNNERWTEDRDGQICRMAKEAARDRLKAATNVRDDEKQKEQVKWALQSESEYRLRAALRLAKTTSPISDAGDGWDSAPFLMGVRNGAVDLHTGQLRPAQPEDRITINATVPFDVGAKCSRFEQFLTEVFLDDMEVVGFVQRAVGYCLTADVTEQCLFLCYGEGANGKSTFLEVIRYVLGGYAHNLPFSAFELTARTGISNDMAGLVGKRFVTAVETNEDARFNEGRIKALTGGDQFTARFLYSEYFTFEPTAKFWLAFNHKPRVADDSHGFWRRIRLIPFLAKFDDAAKDKQLGSKLRAESTGILAWAVRGCLLWQQQGLGLPPAVSEATRAYREESDPLADFLEERYECCPEAYVEKARVRQDYEQWANGNGEKPIDPRSFGERLRARGFVDSRMGHNRVRGWKGLKPCNKLSDICGNADARTDADAKIQ
jgi:putative DNA primase/helicase